MSDSTCFGKDKNLSRRSFLAGAGATALTALLAGCATGSGNSTGQNNQTSTSTESSTPSNSSQTATSGKVLVAYYSAQGHTKRVAERLASDLSADIFEIVPAQPYSTDDLNFSNDSSRVVREYQNQDQRDTPLVQTTPDAFAGYDTVLVGYPIWWQDSAWAMWHFASDNDFSGKKVIPFCTSMSSGLGRSGDNLAQRAGTGDWQMGQRFGENASENDIDSWASGLSV